MPVDAFLRWAAWAAGQISIELDAQREAPAVINHTQKLFREPTMGAEGRVVEIQGGKYALICGVILQLALKSTCVLALTKVGSVPKCELLCRWPK